jgi:hypothetical protein
MSEIQEARHKLISYYINKLCDDCLNYDIHTQDTQEIPPIFSDEDVMNVAVIFNTVMSNRATHKMKDDRISLKYGIELAEGFGNDISKLVLAMTGVNTKEYYKKRK